MTILEKDILSIIPQRPPFVMIDSLIACDTGGSRSIFNIKADNILVFNGLLSEAGLLENIAQTAAAGMGYLHQQQRGPVTTGYIGSIKHLEIFRLPLAGQIITTEVEFEDRVFDVIIISGKISHQDELLARCKMNIYIQNQDI